MNLTYPLKFDADAAANEIDEEPVEKPTRKAQKAPPADEPEESSSHGHGGGPDLCCGGPKPKKIPKNASIFERFNWSAIFILALTVN
jgi:hypothetical protein